MTANARAIPFVAELKYPWDRWYGDRRETRTLILVALEEAGEPLTADEIAQRLGRPWPELKAAPLLGWLRRRGYVSSPGFKGHVKLWSLTEKGRLALSGQSSSSL